MPRPSPIRSALVARIRVSTIVDASPAEVWADVQDISSHVEWMADATAIRFLGGQTSGAGTRFGRQGTGL